MTGNVPRIGILGCAEVVDYALLGPARETGALDLAAVASRDADRAARWAAERQIPRSYGSYAELLAAGKLDAVYVPLPNSMHHEWVIKALVAGYPVFCEKPLAGNAVHAAEMAAVAARTGLPLVEAFHWRHHPIAGRIRALVTEGAVGPVTRIDTLFRIGQDYVRPDNIRHDYAVGGGALMDQGCYCINLLRWITGTEPRVVQASAVEGNPGVDNEMVAELAFSDGIAGSVDVSMVASPGNLFCKARIEGETGRITVENPFLPHMGHRILIEAGNGTWEETLSPHSSYHFQALYFAALLRGEPCDAILPPDDGVANMAVIDAIYRAAGLPARP